MNRNIMIAGDVVIFNHWQVALYFRLLSDYNGWRPHLYQVAMRGTH